MLGTFHSILMPISYLLFLFIILLNQRQKKTLNNMDSISSPNDENVGCFMRVCNKITSFFKRLYENMIKFGVEAKKLGKDDPRRIYHSLKVGLAITVVSLFYYFQPIYDGFGVSAMWAVITVVVVFEYTVGATLGKGFNRMISTLVAGFLGVLAHYVADLSGNTGEPILLALFGFIVAAIFTFMRFFPKLKARYDYGLMIFILTFALVAVSGYRDDEVIKMAQQRLWTVMIGSMIAMLICVFISPVWTGTELHNLIASNIENLAIFFQGFGSEYLQTTEKNTNQDVSNFRQQYKRALATKTTEETMANFAKWEPAHGMFKFRHPWKQYLKIGTLVRHCAFRVDALDNYLDYDMQQTQHVIQENIKETCKKLSYELGNVMKEVASSIKKMKKTPAVKSLLTETKLAAQDLKTLLQDKSLWEKFNLLEVLPLATVASILIDIVTCVENIVEEVHELGCMANFKSNENAIGPVKEMFDVIGPHYVVTVDVDKEATDRSKVIPDHKGMVSSAEAEIKISCQ